MEKQISAVEWLENEFKEMCKDFGGLHTDFIEKFEQAKAMEKEQKIAFGYRCIGEVDSELGDLIYKKVPEEIYNETFKTE